MKKITLLFLLFPLVLLAKVYPGTVTFNDDSTKSGFIEIPKKDDKNLKFKATKEGSFEKFEASNIKSIEVNWDGDTVKFLALYITSASIFNLKSPKLEKNKSWLAVAKEGKSLSLLSTYSASQKIHGAPGSTNLSGTTYYVYKPKQNFCAIFYMTFEGSVVVVGGYKSLQKMLNAYFEEDCPKVIELTTKEAFNKEGIGIVVDIYDEYCG